MAGGRDFPVQVGDVVRYDGYAPEVTGIIVEQIDEEYVRVKWTDLTSATTHRRSSLRRARSAVAVAV